MPELSRFYFGKLEFDYFGTKLDEYINSNLEKDFSGEKKLIDYIKQKGPVYEPEDEKWYFGKIREEENYFMGKYGKISEDETVTKYIEEEGDFREVPHEGEDVEYSFFIIKPSKGLIIFNQRQRIRHKKFIKSFEEGYNEHHPNSKITVGLLKDPNNVEKVIDSQRKIRNVDFKINPIKIKENNLELSNNLETLNATKLEITAKNQKKNESINLEKDNLLRNVLRITENGIGTYNIDYESKDGNLETITSKEEYAIHKEERPQNFQELYGYAPKLIERGEKLIEYN